MLAGALLHELHKANCEAPYANLGANVQKLRQDPETKARNGKQALQRRPHAFRRELLLLRGRALARREFNKHEHQRQHHQYGADNQIGADHLTDHLMACHICGGGGHRQQLFMARIVFAKDHHLANQHAGNHAQRVEDLRKVNALGGGLNRAQQAGVGICRRFQKRESAGDHPQAGEERAIGHDLCGGDEQEAAEGVQAQPDNNRRFIGITLNQRRRRQGDKKVAEEKYRLHQRRLGIR